MSLIGVCFLSACVQEPVYRRFVKMLGEKVNDAMRSLISHYLSTMPQKIIPRSVSFVLQTGAEEYTPARIKGAHRALEKMGLRSDGRQWMADNVCGLK